MKIRSQGILGEELLPPPWREFLDAGKGMRVDPLQHVDQVRVGIDLVEHAGRDQALDDADPAENEQEHGTEEKKFCCERPSL